MGYGVGKTKHGGRQVVRGAEFKIDATGWNGTRNENGLKKNWKSC